MDNSELLEAYDRRGEEFEGRIARGIAENRMAHMRLHIVDGEGRPAEGADVAVRQITHEFKFGCSIFLLDEFETEEENRRYRETFRDVFNLAVAPFYWSTLEPEDGKPRYAKDSPKIYRRPAPDLVTEYCKQNDIEVKGHVLLYQAFSPKWLPKSEQGFKARVDRRFEELAARYSDSVTTWDCVNESLVSADYRLANFPRDYLFWAFRQAAKHFTRGRLFINEATDAVWRNFRRELSPYYLEIQNLLLRGAQVDGAGLQYHMFYPRADMGRIARELYDPAHLFDVLDTYAALGLPLHISEITIPSYSNGEEDERTQAELLRRLYRLWFSHGAVESIIWWNLVDGTAFVNGAWDENAYHGGLLRRDFTPKPAYLALKELISKEWTTSFEKQNAGAELPFDGFCGDYRVTVRWGGKTTEKAFRLSKSASDDCTVTV